LGRERDPGAFDSVGPITHVPADRGPAGPSADRRS
jgi:hypothetical protein